MKLVRNIFPPVPNLTGSNMAQAMMPVSGPGQGVFDFHSLIEGQIKLELFQEDSIPPESPKIHQNDWNERNETKGEEPDPTQAGLGRMPERIPASTSVQMENPQLAKTSGLPSSLKAETDVPITSFVGSKQLESYRAFSTNNIVTDVKTEPVPIKIESSASRENRALAINILEPAAKVPAGDIRIGHLKDQPAHLAIDKEEANAVINRVVEQKPILAPAAIIVTKAIAQNIPTQQSNAAQNISAILAQNSPRSFQSIEVQLVPKNLGIVEIKIRHSNRHLGIVIETKTKEAESVLRSEIAAISKSLVAAGLSMDEITIRYNPRLEQIDLKDLRFTDAAHNNSVSGSFDSEENQRARDDLDKKFETRPRISNKNPELDQPVSSNSGPRRGIYM